MLRVKKGLLIEDGSALIPAIRCGQNGRKTAGTGESPVEQRGQETNYIQSTSHTSKSESFLLSPNIEPFLLRGESFCDKFCVLE